MSAHRSVFSALLFAGALLGTASSILATEELGWHGWSGEGAASLVYGLAESDHVLISFSCQENDGPINFVYSHEPKSARQDASYAVTLAVGKEVQLVETTGMRLEMDDSFILEGEFSPESRHRMFDLLSLAGTLVVTVEGEASEFPLQGIRAAAASMLETCGG